MASITKVQLLALLDSIARQKQLLNTAMTEAAGTPDANTVAAGAVNNRGRIDAYVDTDAENDLLNAAINNVLLSNADAVALAVFKPLAVAINKNLTGGIVTFLRAQDGRMAPDAAKAINTSFAGAMPADVVFSPAVDPMATFDVTGSGTGTFTDGTAIDKAKYAAQQLTLYVSNVGGTGGASATYAVTLQKGSAATEVRNVVVAGSTPQNTEFAIGASTDRYDNVIGITVTGGTAGDQVKVKAKVERVIDNTDL